MLAAELEKLQIEEGMVSLKVSQVQGFIRSKKDLHKMLTEHGKEQY